MSNIQFGYFNGSKIDENNSADKQGLKFKLPDKVNNKNVELLLTWQGFLSLNKDIDMISAISEYLEHTGEACCGRCVPGKRDTITLAGMIKSLREDSSSEKLEEIKLYAAALVQGAKCYFAPSSVLAMVEILNQCPERITESAGVDKKRNYHFHVASVCTAQCPSHVKIPQFIDQVRGKRFKSALTIIRETLPLAGLCGRICPKPCESACVLNATDQPINIRLLQQSTWNDEFFNNKEVAVPEKSLPNGKRVAIVGAGPAGLSAAYYLALSGFDVDIFDMLDCGGGMALKGIPSFREPRNMLQHEVDLVTSLGVNIYYNKTLGKDIFIDKLSESYDALLLAIGAWVGTDSGIKNIEGINGVARSGIDYLRDVSDGIIPNQGDHVVVIGGGNTAIDCARTALRLGSRSTIVYRRTEVEMPAIKTEVEEGKEEGVEFVMLTAPASAVSTGGNVTGLECIKMQLGEPDASGRRSPVPIPDSNFIIDCSYIIPAIGQKPDITNIVADGRLDLDDWNNVKASPVYCQTKVPNIFAAGDCLTGPETVVRAISTGRRAATMIERFILSGSLYLTEDEALELIVYDNKIYAIPEHYDNIKGKDVVDRYEPTLLDLKKRQTTFEQVEQPIEPADAASEAKRCIRCLRLSMMVTAE